MIPSEWVDQARVRLKPYIRETPLEFDQEIQAYIKWENNQDTGSFKLRGACNKVLMLEPWERDLGLVCASAGNHGQALGWIAAKLGIRAEVFVAGSVPKVKLEKMRVLGVQLHFIAGGYGDAEAAGLAYASGNRKTWISPYNDGQVIAGAGTIALEIMAQLTGTSPVTWLVPIGGGGLISGISTVLAQHEPKPRLIGVQPQDNAFMHHLYYFDSPGDWQDLPSLADGLTGTVEDHAVTIPIVKQSAAEIILVSEHEIARAIAFAWYKHHQIIEGSGAVTLAALLAGKTSSLPAVAIISGGNINPQVHSEILTRYAGEFTA